MSRRRRWRSPTVSRVSAEMLIRGLLGAPRYVDAGCCARCPSTLPNIEDVAVLAQLPGAKTRRPHDGTVARLLRGGEQRVLERSDAEPPRTQLQRPRLAASAVRVRAALARGRQGGQERTRLHRQRRRAVDRAPARCARWLIEHDDLPEDPLVAQVPVSVRSEEQFGTYGNRIGMLSVPLFTNEADPVRAADARRTMRWGSPRSDTRRCRPSCSRTRPSSSRRRCSHARRGSRSRSPRPASRSGTSSSRTCPARSSRCTWPGARLVANYPVSVITDGMGLNITVMSYDGHLDFGIVADREQMRDVWKLIDWLRGRRSRSCCPTRRRSRRPAERTAVRGSGRRRRRGASRPG